MQRAIEAVAAVDIAAWRLIIALVPIVMVAQDDIPAEPQCPK